MFDSVDTTSFIINTHIDHGAFVEHGKSLFYVPDSLLSLSIINKLAELHMASSLYPIYQKKDNKDLARSNLNHLFVTGGVIYLKDGGIDGEHLSTVHIQSVTNVSLRTEEGILMCGDEIGFQYFEHNEVIYGIAKAFCENYAAFNEVTNGAEYAEFLRNLNSSELKDIALIFHEFIKKYSEKFEDFSSNDVFDLLLPELEKLAINNTSGEI